jgi:ketosteroid isomerase-like protein
VPDQLTPGDGQDLFARFKRARERRDVDAMLELFAPDAEYRTHPFADPLEGAVAIRAHWNEAAADQAHVEFDVERVWVSGRTVLASWHGAQTLRTTGGRVRVRGFSTVELDGSGAITRMRDWPLQREVGTDTRFDAGRESETGGHHDG